MRKIARSSVLLDRLHKGVVCACIGVTAYGCYLLSWRFYRYFTVIKPNKEQRELMAKEQLLAEGASDRLIDRTPDLKL